MSKPNCYDCKYRRNVPGDAHSSCVHPKIGEIDSNPFGAVVDMISNPDRITNAARELNIVANPHGVRNGWFWWPANFDPVWLENCSGLEKRE